MSMTLRHFLGIILNNVLTDLKQLWFRYVYYLFVSVALICFVFYLRKIILWYICILHCLVPLIVLFKPCLFQFKHKKNLPN